MGKHILSVLLCFISQFSFSQNWSVINMTDKFNYRLDNDQVISATIWADSVHWNGSDSVFYLNRVLCDSCATIIGGPNSLCDTCYGLKNQPQFMQRKSVVSVSGMVNFRDTNNIVLNTLATLNDTWLFDSVQSVSATVLTISADSVFGNPDSVKTILLTTGDTVKLSKSYGLLQFPNGYGFNSYYRLVGIEGRNLGEHIPRYADFFNFDVGDMFEYHGYSGYLILGQCFPLTPDQYCTWIRKFTVISKTQAADTLFIGISGLRQETCTSISSPFPPFPTCTTATTLSGVIYFVDSAANWLNRSYPNQALKLENIFENYALPCFSNDSAFDFVKVSRDSNSRIAKFVGMENAACSLASVNCNFRYQSEIHRFSDTLFYNTNGPVGEYSQAAATGLGIIHYGVSHCFEGGIGEDLVAYRKGNDTVGVFTPDSVLVSGVGEQASSIELSIFPNPASDQISILFSGYTAGEIRLTDISGQVLLNQILEGDEVTLKTDHLSNGMYFVLIKTKDQVISKRVLVIH
jgi:hypothetical protein